MCQFASEPAQREGRKVLPDAFSRSRLRRPVSVERRVGVGLLLSALVAVTLALPGMRVQAAVSANIVRFPVGHPGAEATAIEQYDGNHAAALAIDGDKTKDWAPNGHAVGDWWRATWGALVTVDRVK